MREKPNQVFGNSEGDGENRRRFLSRHAKEEERHFLEKLEQKIKRGEQFEKAMLTDRDLREYEKFLQLNAQELEGKEILDLGSGEFQKFGRQLTRQFPDTKVTCLDASLAKRHADFLLREDQRKQKLNLSAALFTKLPFKNNSFDIVLSLYGTLYLTTPESKKENIKEIIRVLRNGGEARLYPYYNRTNEAILDEIANASGIRCNLIERALPAAHGKDHFSSALRKMSYCGDDGLLVIKKGFI
ncbi:MAG: class I SAM-dependent methyltransferase [Parcubacteria group bacterium]|nr:class I SAM-dependent methyltransferase [Parcubacteria group bacterium]